MPDPYPYLYPAPRPAPTPGPVPAPGPRPVPRPPFRRGDSVPRQAGRGRGAGRGEGKGVGMGMGTGITRRRRQNSGAGASAPPDPSRTQPPGRSMAPARARSAPGPRHGFGIGQGRQYGRACAGGARGWPRRWPWWLLLNLGEHQRQPALAVLVEPPPIPAGRPRCPCCSSPLGPKAWEIPLCIVCWDADQGRRTDPRSTRCSARRAAGASSASAESAPAARSGWSRTSPNASRNARQARSMAERSDRSHQRRGRVATEGGTGSCRWKKPCGAPRSEREHASRHGQQTPLRPRSGPEENHAKARTKAAQTEEGIPRNPEGRRGSRVQKDASKPPLRPG